MGGMASFKLFGGRIRGRVALAALALFMAACAKSPEGWIAELESEDPYFRRMAAAALGESTPEDSESAFRALLGHANDPSPKARERVHEALFKLAERDLLAWLQQEGGFRFVPGMEPFVTDAIAVHRTEAAQMLVDGLGTRNRVVFESAGRLLPLCGEAAVEPLSRLLELHKRPVALARAARALGAIGVEASTSAPLLRQLTKHESAFARVAALDALLRVDRYGEQTRRELRLLLDDPKPEVRTRAAPVEVLDALEGWGKVTAGERAERISRLRQNESTIEVLIEELEHPRPVRRKQAYMLLSLFSQEGALASDHEPPVVPGRTASSAARARFAWGVARNGSSDRAEVELVTAMLGDPRASVRVCAVLALGRLGKAQLLSEHKPSEESELVGFVLRNTLRSLRDRKQRDAKGDEH